MDRRHFIHAGGMFLGASAIGMPYRTINPQIFRSPQTAMVMDAMGENVYQIYREVIG